MAQITIEGRSGLKANIGTVLGPSEWVRIGQASIDSFASAVNDGEWIHVDVDRARSTKIGTTIAQGYLTVGLIPGLLRAVVRVNGFARGTNYGANKIRFPAVVPCGSDVRLQASIVDVSDVSGGVQVTYQCTVELAGSEKPVCVAETVFRFFD